MKNFKKLFCLLCVLSLVFLTACGGNDGGSSSSSSSSGSYELPDEEPGGEYISILTDKKYKKGFTVRGLGLPIYPDRAEEETYGTELYDPGYKFQYGKTDLGEPVWEICQWATRYAFHNPAITTFTDNGGGSYTYENKSKLFKVNTATGEVTLGLKGTECYVYGDREVMQEWPHLLVSRDINKNAFTKLSDKSEMRVQMDISLDVLEDHMTVEPHPGIHAAQCMFYLYVGNFNESLNSFDDMLWLGMSLFDSRYEFTDTYARGDVDSKESETGKYIYNVASSEYFTPESNFYRNGEIIVDKGRFLNIDFDILPFVSTALEMAKTDGFMPHSSFENLYVYGMYIGFELPGTYNLQMTYKNLDVKVKYA